MYLKGRKAKRFKGTIVISLLILTSVLIYFAQESVDIKLSSLKRIVGGREDANKAKVVLEFSSGDQNLLIKFAVPCADQRQWDDVTSKLVKIKHECLMALHRSDTAEFIRQRNFEAIRKVLVRTLNGVVNQPVETVFFENITSY